MRRPTFLSAALCFLALAIGLPVAAAEVIQRDGTRVSIEAAISPRRLPRSGAAPIHFSLATKIAATEGSVPPQLRRISIEINRYGNFDPAALPACTYAEIQPSNNEGALAACRDSLIGEGSFAAKVLIASQAPFPSVGKVLAFNGRWPVGPGCAPAGAASLSGRIRPSSPRTQEGRQGERAAARDPRAAARGRRNAKCRMRPAILAHIYGTQPVPTSYTLPFLLDRSGSGQWGTTLSASLPGFTSQWGYVTGIALYLGRVDGRRSYLTASCPAPGGFPGASFPLARTTLSFAGRGPMSETLIRSCKVR